MSTSQVWFLSPAFFSNSSRSPVSENPVYKGFAATLRYKLKSLVAALWFTAVASPYQKTQRGLSSYNQYVNIMLVLQHWQRIWLIDNNCSIEEERWKAGIAVDAKLTYFSTQKSKAKILTLSLLYFCMIIKRFQLYFYFSLSKFACVAVMLPVWVFS